MTDRFLRSGILRWTHCGFGRAAWGRGADRQNRGLPALPARAGLAVWCLLMSVPGVNAQELPVEGNPNSTVRIIEYEDLACGDCANYRTMLDEHLLPQFGDRAAFVHKDFPLPKHPWAARAAVAGRFFASKDAEIALVFRRHCLFNRYEITTENFNEKLAAFAGQHGLDPQEAVASLGDKTLQQLVNRDFQEGVARGVSKTPTVYVAGKPFVEVFAVEDLSAAIETALATAQTIQ
jgi:protein-disulfide isomerase